MFDYVSLDEMKADSGNARFFDDVAEGLHDHTVYDFIKENIHDLHPFSLTGLLESLDGHDLDLIEKCTDWFEIKVLKGRMLDGRKERAKVVVKYCPREYILAHLEELDRKCNYATLCLRTGIEPDPERLPAWTYLYVLKTSGGQLRFREGEEENKRLRRICVNNFRLICKIGQEAGILPDEAVKEALEGVEDQ